MNIEHFLTNALENHFLDKKIRIKNEEFHCCVITMEQDCNRLFIWFGDDKDFYKYYILFPSDELPEIIKDN